MGGEGRSGQRKRRAPSKQNISTQEGTVHESQRDQHKHDDQTNTMHPTHPAVIAAGEKPRNKSPHKKAEH